MSGNKEAILEESLQSVQVRIQNLRQLKTDLRNEIEEVGSTRQKLEKEGDDFFSDIFRPDNPKRRKDAIKALKILEREIDTALEKAAELENLSVELKLVIGYMHDWSDCVIGLIPLLKLNVAVPEFSTTFTDVWHDLMNIGLIIASVFLASTLVTGPLGLTGFAITLGALGLLGLIGGIFAAQERKDAFENIKRKADKTTAKIQQEVTAKLAKALAETHQFFNDAALSLKRAGLSDSDSLSPEKVAKAFETHVGVIKQWRDGYHIMTTLIHNKQMDGTEAAKLGATVLAGGDSVKQAKLAKVLHGAYLLDKGDSVADIAKILEISAEEAKQLQAREMLMKGKTPADIAKILNMPQSKVDRVKNRNEELSAMIQQFHARAA